MLGRRARSPDDGPARDAGRPAAGDRGEERDGDSGSEHARRTAPADPQRTERDGSGTGRRHGRGRRRAARRRLRRCCSRSSSRTTTRSARRGAFSVGIGVTAYTLGMRHAFDADHIAAIDNTTRKLMAEGKRPLSVGFFFSLGHSTVVFGLALLFAIGVRALAGPVENDGSTLHDVTGLIGTTVSGHVPLRDRCAQRGRSWSGSSGCSARCARGRYDEAELEAQLELARADEPLPRPRSRGRSRKPWQMYPLGDAVRPRLRHRDRGRAARARGRRRRRGPAVVRDPLPAGPVRRRACRCSTRSTARS